MTGRGLAALALVVALSACTGGAAPARSPAPPAPPGPASPAAGSLVAPREDWSALECWEARPPGGGPALSFADLTGRLGLLAPLTGMRGHAGAWGDVNGDGWVDLFVGTFADRPVEDYRARGASGPAPDRLLLGGPDGFRPSPGFPREFGRTSGAAFADLDGDGDPDLVASRNTSPGERAGLPTEVMENREGAFRVVRDAGVPPTLVGRSVGVLDFDRDGLLDLLVAEDPRSGGSSVLLRNLGGLRFADATRAAGLPPDLAGFGVGVGDLTGDGLPDVVVAGSNRMFVADGRGGFREADSAVLRWERYGEEDDVTGVAIADLNRDGRADVVLGHHYNSTLEFGRRVPVRLYLNRGVDGRGDPRLEDVTDRAGLVGLPTKAPHVEVADLDNDGWPDLLTTASASGGTRPAVFRHLGLGAGGIPRFAAPEGLGSPQYWVAGPTADVDRDGRLDVLLVEWDPRLPSLLLRNQTASGGWLEVSVSGPGGGVGTRVEVYREGGLGDPAALLGARDIVASEGYASGQVAVAHFGTGPVRSVDVRVVPPDGDQLVVRGVPAGRHLRFPGGCG